MLKLYTVQDILIASSPTVQSGYLGETLKFKGQVAKVILFLNYVYEAFFLSCSKAHEFPTL